ncbi:MAG: sigma-70 family RNA polymerase sigma factor [bacterium]|nr:sigma-70 family RNA polymerase sigma factor [bacterium]
MSTETTMTRLPSETEDREERARAGDAAAREELLELARDELVRFCFRYLGDAHEAEDAAQDVLASVARPGGWPGGAFRSWLLRVARNRCLGTLRRRRDGRVGVGSLLGASRPSPRTGPATSSARRERQEVLRAYLTALPDHHAEVLLLRYFDDLDRAGIAEVLELSVSVVKSRLFEARKELRKRMGDRAP